MDTTKYKQLEYVTNYKNPDTTVFISCLDLTGKAKVELKYIPMKINSSNGWIFGHNSNSSSRSYIIGDNYYANSTFRLDAPIPLLTIGQYYDVIADGLNATFTVNDQVASKTKPTAYNELTDKAFRIINGHRSGKNVNNVYKWYGTTIWLDGENLSYDFVPCKRLEDNVVGVYDTVNDAFYKPTRGALEEPFIFEDNVVGVQIPEGRVIRIEDNEGHLLWSATEDSIPKFISATPESSDSFTYTLSNYQFNINNISEEQEVTIYLSGSVTSIALQISGLDTYNDDSFIKFQKESGTITVQSNGLYTIPILEEDGNKCLKFTLGKSTGGGASSNPIKFIIT